MASSVWPGVQPLGRRAQRAREDLPEAPVAPDLQDARWTDVLEGFKASLFGLSTHFESQIAAAA